MRATLRRVTPPSTTAVDLDTALLHARIDSDDARDLFKLYLTSAANLVENYLGRSLVTQTLMWTVSEGSANQGWPGSSALMDMGLLHSWNLGSRPQGTVELPYSPVQEVLSVRVDGWRDDGQTLQQGTDYWVDVEQEPARLRLKPIHLYPRNANLCVTYRAGYGPGPDSIPAPITNAIMMLATNLYENRGDDDKGGMSKAVKSLLTPYRLVTF